MLATGSFDATVGIWRRWDTYGSTEEGDRDGLTGGGVSRRAALDTGEEEGGNGGEEEEEDEDEEWRFAVLLDGHDSEVKSVSWSPAGSLLATCSRDKSIWIWEDLDDGDNNFETVAVMQEHSGDVKCVAWHPTEECLASGSYDDTIRLWREDIDDWGQIACLKGHEGTVWFIDWEAGEAIVPKDAQPHQKKQWEERHSLSGPRLASCSDDRTVRIWRKEARQAPSFPQPSAVPSIIRPSGIDETWFEDTQLPVIHDLSIYSVAWSKRSGLIASAGADGRIVVYREQITTSSAGQDNGEATTNGDLDMDRSSPAATASNTDADPSTFSSSSSNLRTEWQVLATIDGAHGIYEVNHVCWAKRADRNKAEGIEEEVLLSTGDDGSVKVWKIAKD